MAERLPYEGQVFVDLLVNRDCAGCGEDLAGQTTQAAIRSGKEFDQIFAQLAPVYPEPGVIAVRFIHRNHLN